MTAGKKQAGRGANVEDADTGSRAPNAETRSKVGAERLAGRVTRSRPFTQSPGVRVTIAEAWVDRALTEPETGRVT